MSFQKEIRALQSQIDLNTNTLRILNFSVEEMTDQNRSSYIEEYEYKHNTTWIRLYKRRMKQLAENQRVLKSIIGEYIRMDRVFKE